MEGLLIFVALIGFASLGRLWLRMYLTVKHPKIRDAWDEAETRKQDQRKRLAGGALNAGIGITKMFLKK